MELPEQGLFPEVWSSLEPGVCYLNSAGRTPLPTPTLAVGLRAVARKASTPWSIGDTTAEADEVRQLFAELLGFGVDADDVAVMPSCSYAMSLAAANLRHRLRARPHGSLRVVVLRDQNPSNVMPWQRLCKEEAGELWVVGPRHDAAEASSADAAVDWTSEVVAAVSTGRVAIAALPPCHWCDGALVELGAVAASCAAASCALVLDATQWLGAAPSFDVTALGACFVACSVHKWLCGPYGACLVYAPRSFWRGARPLEDHDRNREGAQYVECLPMRATVAEQDGVRDGVRDGARDGVRDAPGYPTAFQHGCRRLDGGGRPSYIVMPMLRCSLTLLVRQMGVAVVAAHVGAFTAALASRARAIGFSVPARHAPNIVGLRPARHMPSAATIVRTLGARALPIIVGERLGAVRISPHLHNGRADLEALLAALQEAITPAIEGGGITSPPGPSTTGKPIAPEMAVLRPKL